MLKSHTDDEKIQFNNNKTVIIMGCIIVINTLTKTLNLDNSNDWNEILLLTEYYTVKSWSETLNQIIIGIV